MKNTIQILKLLPTLAATALALGVYGNAEAQVKPNPAGIIALFSNLAPPKTIGDLSKHKAWTNPQVDGVRMRMGWNAVQPLSVTTYDWSQVDQSLSNGTQSGNLVGLGISAGLRTPEWVYQAGATKYVLSNGSGAMVIPWEEAFLTQWLAFVRALGARYDGNPALGYIVMGGLGQNFETYVAKTTADIAQLTALGGPAAWVGAAKRIIAVYAEAFPRTPFFITMAQPFPGGAGMSALQEVVNWGVATYPGRFGLMTASLNVKSNTGFWLNWAISTYYTTQPTGFQMLCSSSQSLLGGTLDQALRAGYQLGGKFVEVYEPDVDDPAQQTVLAIEGAALKSNVRPAAPTNLRIR